MPKNKKLNIKNLEEILLAAKNNKLISIRIYTSHYGKNKGVLMADYTISKSLVKPNTKDYSSVIRAITDIQKAFINKTFVSIEFNFEFNKDNFIYRIVENIQCLE